MSPILKIYFKNLLKTLLIMGVFFVIHFYIECEYKKESYYPLWSIYLFHMMSVFLINMLLKRDFGRKDYSIANRFLFVTALQMLLCLFFLIPLFLENQMDKEWDTLSFITVFFVALFSEVFFALSLLNYQEANKIND